MSSSLVIPMGRVRRELRLRVDALHRQRERQAATDPRGYGAEVEAQTHLHLDMTDAPPLTLASQIAEEFRRRRRLRVLDDRMLEQVRGWAISEGRWAFGRDPSLRACAAFGVERALYRATRLLPFDTHPPDCIVRGEPFNAHFAPLKNRWIFEQADPDWPNPLTLGDRADIRRLVVDWDQIGSAGVVTASWSPKTPRTIFTCDVMRPPVEAMVLASHAIDPPVQPVRLRLDKQPAVLCVGTGWGSGPQALSLMLSLHRVYHLPIPFAVKVPPNIDWDAVVINIPSVHHWTAAQASSRPGELPHYIHQAAVRGKLGGQGIIAGIIEAAAQHCRSGRLVVLMADYEMYESGMAELLSSSDLVPQLVCGIDTSSRPIWVGYQTRPWAPHGFPRPSGRLVSFWRVAR